MELLYLWVDWYNNIKHQGFCFSKEYCFSFEEETNTLSINRNNYANPNLFDPSFINITALVGMNGSGKTSLFNLLKEIFSDNFYHRNNYILISKTAEGKFYCIDRISNGKKNLLIKNEINTDEIISFNNSDDLMSKVNLIFHSTSFSINDEEVLQRIRFSDISIGASLKHFSIQSNNELLERYEMYLKMFEVEPTDKKNREQNISDIKRAIANGFIPERDMFQYDLETKIKFISNYKNEKWDFIPTYLDAYFNQAFFFKNIDYFKAEGLQDKINEIQFLLFQDTSHDNSFEIRKAQFVNRLLIYLFLYIIRNPVYSNESKKDLETTILKINNSPDFRTIPEIIKSYFNAQDIPKWQHPHKDLLVFAKNLENEFDAFKQGYCEFRYAECNSFAITDGLRESLNSIFKFWRDQYFIFRFSWSGLSAGQSSLLTVFSRLNYISENFIGDNVFWIIIDEGELYLHPEWQRSFFFNLHKYLPLFFKKKIQLIISSHSPFIVSDLPKENIILLNRTESVFCEIIDKSKFELSFAANIHSLLANPFFMNNGFIGEFAKEKITQLIYDLNPKNETKYFDRNDIPEIIALIGEPLIKDRLQKMYEKKFITDTQLKSKIEELQHELSRRKSEKNKN